MILVECNNDIKLMFRLGFIPEQIDHTGSKSAVLDGLELMKERFDIGIIDKDESNRQPELLELYKLHSKIRKLSKNRSIMSIALMENQNNKNKILIVISPHLEGWIYEVAKRKKLLPSNYGLPDDPDTFHHRDKEFTNEYQRLLIDLIKKRDWEINTLRQWITETIQQQGIMP
jgi:hypothetical protein